MAPPELPPDRESYNITALPTPERTTTLDESQINSHHARTTTPDESKITSHHARSYSVFEADDIEKPAAHIESDVRGAAKIERFSETLYNSGRKGRVLLIILIISLALTMFALAMDQGITTQIHLVAASAFNHHADLGAINTASSIIWAISKPFLGKLSDITSRPATYVVVLVFFVLGFVIASTSQGIASYTVGISLATVGKSGLDLLSSIICADLTPLQWRGFWSSLLYSPFIVTTFVNGFISEAFIPEKWRWGLGMFGIMIPVILVPTIWTLYGIQRVTEKREKARLADSAYAQPSEEKTRNARSYLVIVWQGIIDIDLPGLLLLGTAFSLILLSLSLAESAKGGWKNPSMIAMMVSGWVVLIFFGLFEGFLAPKPIMKRSIIVNRGFMAALMVTICTQIASAARTSYLPSYIYIIKDWSNYVWTVFLGITPLVLAFTGPFGGLIQRGTHRYKTLMLVGAIFETIGNAMIITPSGRSTTNTAALIISQIMVGLGSFAVIGSWVGSQASVAHGDISTVISVLALWGILGTSIGSAIAASIWTNCMVDFMREEMPPGTPDAIVLKIYGSIQSLRFQFEPEHPIRMAAVRAYTRVNGIIFITATVIGALSIFFTLAMPNHRLDKRHNAVTNTDVGGNIVEVEGDTSERRYAGPGLLNWLRRKYYKET